METDSEEEIIEILSSDEEDEQTLLEEKLQENKEIELKKSNKHPHNLSDRQIRETLVKQGSVVGSKADNRAKLEAEYFLNKRNR